MRRLHPGTRCTVGWRYRDLINTGIGLILDLDRVVGITHVEHAVTITAVECRGTQRVHSIIELLRQSRVFVNVRYQCHGYLLIVNSSCGTATSYGVTSSSVRASRASVSTSGIRSTNRVR